MPRRSSLDPFAPPPDDDPFAADPPAFVAARGVPAAGTEPRPAIARPLVDRDPFAPPDETSEHAVGGAASFDDLLRRARRQGFLAGGLAGGAAAATFVAVTWLLVGTASVPTMEVRGELRAAEVDADVAPLAGPGTPLDPAPPGPAPAARAAVPAADPVPSAPPSPRRRRPGVAASDEAPRPGPAAVAPLAEEPPRVEDAGATPAPHPETEAAHVEVAAADAGPGEALAGAAPEAGPADAPAVEPPRAPGEREVMAALREHGEAIDECVALALGAEGDVRGRRFRLLVAIDPGGAVRDARVLDPGVETTPLGSCLVGVARELAFPPFEGEAVEVELPVRYGRSG